MNSKSKLVELGFVLSAYGIKGAVKVKSYSDRAKALLSNNIWNLALPNKAESCEDNNYQKYLILKSYFYKNNVIIAYINGIYDRNASENLKGFKIYIERSLFPQEDDDEYYYVDLIGCDFYIKIKEKSSKFGVVVDIFHNGAHPILKIIADNTNYYRSLNEKREYTEILVPFIEKYISNVDINNRVIYSTWPI